ncbi:myosin phosphatase Rho-interacting protein isoform C [Alligator mississippiensis]|uniref:Myosin phosphatase Rho-interacting protein isoform C n=1 Tax=Alligator mississippiensis TaxID=8496 RepID=A0A151N1Z4_ALLMI|nr:myosin phosphatase Rho-interacting protein isoform C [Alligator mississippiensis]
MVRRRGALGRAAVGEEGAEIQAKPIYGGWLLLAPEGTDFDNPVHRSRKWQRRFFILYEHGLLRYALDEMPTTLPQGTINMNQCTDVVDGESRTGQKFSLCILTPEKEHFIRAENKEIISGWLEMLIVYPRTNKQNQKKKRKVEPPTPQEPGPAKMAVTSSNIPSAEKVPATKSTLWQEEMRGKDQADGSSSLSPVQSPVQNQAAPASSLKEPVLESKEDESSMNGDRLDCGRKARVESGYFSLEKTKQDSKLEEQQLLPPPSPPSPSTPNNRRSQVIEKFEALDIENSEHMETNVLPGSALSSETRQGRSEKRVFPRKRDSETAAVGSIPEVSASPLSPHRRAKSLDRRSTESSMTPDLLNFKKGWLTKQYEDGQWKKHWFVLTDQSLRYYRDSKAEEAADLDGEIDLSTCYDVTEYPVQRNYGFQIHTKEGEFTLSAMTSGIRRNWIQTIMKHVRPTTAPDVTSSLPEEKSKTSSSFETCPKPSEKQDLDQAEMDPEQKRSRARERRREGRSKTFDWAEFRPIQQALAQERASTAESAKGGTPTFPREPSVLDTDAGELERERARRREERRKRFEMTDAVDGTGSEDALRMEVDRVPGLPVTTDVKPQNVHVEIEQRWHQVETTPLREEKQIPIMPLHLTHSEDREDRLSNHHLTTLLEKELEQSQKEALDLLEQNRLLQDQLKVALGREQSAREGYVLQTEVAASPSGAWQRLHKVNQDLQSELEAQCQRQELINQQIQSLKRSYGEAKDVIRHHEAEIQSLQARLGNAAAELSIKEQTLAKLKSDLKMEKEKAKEQLEEWQHSETTLSSQLKVSEQKLKAAEALLLEKTQELRDLEVQQALQRDHQKEVQRLQDRIADLSMQLSASERARILMEEKLQKNYEALLESCEKEKQVLIQSLKEVEDKANEYENQLQNNEQQMEILQKEKLNAKCEGSEIVHQLEEQLEMKEASIQKLAEHIEELERERDQIKCRFQELMNQVAESDNEVAKLQAKLKMEETNYQNLEHSYEEVSDQFQSMQEVLKEKEEELRHVKEMHLRIVEKKDQDLNEALVKMAALGSSLEETEVKLQAKEDALQKLANAGSGPCAEDAEDFCTNLEADENPNPELGQHLQTRDELPGLHYTPKDDDEGASDSETYLSIIHSLETKLYITEEKLKDVTLKLESQQAIALANLLSKKLLLEGEFWSQVEELRKHLGTKDKEVEGKMETLKDKANILKEISVALLSLSPEEAIQDCQKLLKVSQSMGDLERYSSLLVQDAVIQAQERGQAVAVLREEYEDLLRKQRSEYGEMITILERENADLQAKVSQLENQRRLLEEEEHKRSKSISELKSRYEEEIRNVIEQLNRTEDTLKAERAEGLNQLDAVVRDKQDMERYHLEQMQTLEDRFQAKVKELQVIHSEELQTLQEHYSQNLQRLQGTLDDYQRQHPEAVPSQGPGTARTAEQPSGGMQLSESELNSMHGLRERIQELEAQMDAMRDELENKHLEGSTATLREKYQKDFENLKATCERGFAAMEETHQKKIEDLQRQHQRELEKLREEKDRLLAEETAATISAIEAMKNAHREELERELEKSQRSQISSVNADIEALRRQYLEELQSVQRELEVLSEQYSQKCLENAHLAQALEAERQALRQCQRENQELNAHNQELNNRLAAEITQLRTLLTGEGGGEAAGSPLTQGKDAYELEVLLRVKESEIQYLKQEISSLKDELQTALREKKYASDKHKDIYTELSIVKAKADCDISRLKEQLKAATEALGEKSPENTSVSGYDIMKSKSQSPLLSRSHGKTERNQSPGSLSRRV